MKTKQLRIAFLLWTFILATISYSNTASACACCARDNTWFQSETSLSDDYMGGLLGALQVQDGSISSMDGELDQSIISTNRSGKQMEFTLENKAVITLDLNNPVNHRQTDVSFLIPSDSKQIDNATIYHELILSGKITLSDAAKPLFKEAQLPDSFDVNVVFQGAGNSCLQENDIKRWIILPKMNQHDFAAAGKFKATN